MSDRFKTLFEPVKIGPKVAPNRFFAVPHATGHGWHQPQGEIALRAMKAEGGWGTVAVQMTEIGPDSDMANHPMQRLWDDSDIPRHAAQVEAIKRHGSLAAIELAHGGMRARNFVTGEPPVGPSAMPILRPEVPLQARAMDLSDIAAFRRRHKQAVRRALSAGYDIIYVYAAHDLSILSHFLSLRTNRRTDAYGGSFENRLRLLKEVMEDTLEVADGHAAVALRFAVAEPSKSVGLRHDGEGRDVVEALSELPDLWDVNIAGWPDDSATARFAEEGHQLPFTDFVKGITSKPVVGVGRFTSPDLMVSLIKQGKLDLIGAARPSIADPFLPTKLREDRIEDIRECIGCNICVSMDGYGVPIRCTQNATISEEWRREWHPEVFPSSKRVSHTLIVGGGPAGLECARVLINGGQHVTVAEASGAFGGRVTREATLPGLSSFLRVRDYRVGALNASADAELYLKSALTVADIADFAADDVVIATGGRWRRDGVGGFNPFPMDFADLDMLNPDDILAGQRPKKPSVVVYDDDHFYVASAIAESLANEGLEVAYVTPHSMVAAWTDMNLDQEAVTKRLNERGVAMYVNTKLTQSLEFRSLLDGKTVEIGAASLVHVGARLPADDLLEPLRATMAQENVHLAGDALVPGLIQGAVYSGHRVARTLLGHQVAPKREYAV